MLFITRYALYPIIIKDKSCFYWNSGRLISSNIIGLGMGCQDEILEWRCNAETCQLDECRLRDIRHEEVGNTNEAIGPKGI